MKPTSTHRVETTQILVIGGGPVGLFAALCAARRGLDVIVLEQNFRGYAHGRAAILHPSSVCLLAELGLSQPLLAAGSALNSVRLHIAGAPVTTVQLPIPALTVPQTVLEEILLKALRRETVQIKSPCEVRRLGQSANSVLATVERRELVTLGSPAHFSEWQPVDSSLIEARFVIGADGYESFVRGALGIANIQAGATETFAMFEGPASREDDSLALALDSDFTSAIYPLPEQRMRWGFQVGSELDREPDLEFLHALLAKRAPWFSEKPERVDWSTVTHFERRLARSFGRERIWLAGDAAHITSPFGAQSMNGGLLEAHELVDCMAQCIFAKKPLASLEQWNDMRQCEWRRLFGLQAQLETQPHAPTWLAHQATRIIPALPASGSDLQQILRELGLRVT